MKSLLRQGLINRSLQKTDDRAIPMCLAQGTIPKPDISGLVLSGYHWIDATDKQIGKLVYELYELTPEEIKIVEGK